MFEEMRIAMDAVDSVIGALCEGWRWSEMVERANTEITGDMDEWERRRILEAKEYIALVDGIKEYCTKYIKNKIK